MWSHYLNRYLWLNPDEIQSSLFNVFRMRCYVFCRSTAGSIEELENVDCKPTGSIEEPENNGEHMIPAVTEMKRVFATYDENGDGYICKSELERFMRKLDVDVSEEEILYMIDSVDVNRDGCVDFEEFLELHTSLAERDQEGCGAEQHDEDAELLEAFQVFDRNQDGFISETELQTVLRNLGINPGVKVQDCQRMISAVDRNNDGQVDFSEFQQLMSSIPCAA